MKPFYSRVIPVIIFMGILSPGFVVENLITVSKFNIVLLTYYFKVSK